MGFVKVKSIKKIGKRKVVDICVPKTDNFILANGILSHNSSQNPVQKKFHKMLMPGEKPTGMPVYAFRPVFFEPFDHGEVPVDNDYASLNIADMESVDFFTAMNAEEMTIPQKISMDIVFDEIKKRGGAIKSIDDIKAIIDDIEEINITQKNSLKYKLRPLEKMRLFEPKYNINPIAIIQRGFYPTVNLQNFDEFSEQFGNGFPQIFVSVWLRGIIRARRAGLIPPVYVILDELPRFAPADDNNNPSCKEVIIQSAELDRRYGIRYIYAAQTITSIPPRILKNCRYLYLPYNIDLETLKTVMKDMGMLEWSPTQSHELMRIKKMMRRYDWVIFDKDFGNYTVITPPAPLSWHSEVEN